MEQQDITLSDWYKILTERFEGAPREASRFYNLQMLPRLMHCLNKQKEFCPICKDHFNKLDKVTLHITEWFKDEGDELKEYQKQIESIIKHLQSDHGTFAKGLWLSRIVVIGLAIGILVAYLSNLLFPETEKSGLLVLGSVIGMMLGWIAGKMYENQLRKRNKIF